MYDSVNAGAIPANAEIVAGYVEGRYRWSQADWNRFPNAIKITIAIWSADADVLDVETGDATPGMAPDWVRRQKARGLAMPTVYCNRSTWPLVRDALAAAGYANGQDYDLWLADYTQVAHCPSYAACCQYADPGPYDLSLCQDYWPRGGDDLPDKPTTQAWIREVLDEGTALGQGSWRDTNKALLATIQAVYNMDNGELGNENAQARILQEILDGIKALAAQGVPPANLQPLLDAIKGLTLKAV